MARGVTRAISGFKRRACIGLASSHPMIEPRSGDTPVGFLIRSHVVVVVPGNVLPSPFRVEVCALVHAMVANRVVTDGCREKGRNRQ